MLLVVTGVGLLIHIYSIGYMAHEGGYYRFFAYMNLFMFFMLVLVLAANYLVLFVGWEGVGLCSYLLIGFYFIKKFATNAGNKAFIVNRIGDFGFSLAMFLIFVNFGSLDFGSVFHQAPSASTGVLTTIGLLLLVGACGKSAQLPLYVWLPDAMAGPTPVSALIHAATMVTAGVYMTARSWPIYMHAPAAMETIAIIGIATAFFAASIGLVQNDIKKVFAYSTVSQLGYMFLGVGCGAFSAGIWHLMTHAFFKALLFLGAGSVIHALSGEQDMRNMGGLRDQDPLDLLDHDVRRRGNRRRAAVLRILQQGRYPAGGLSSRALDVLARRGDRRHDRVLRVSRDLPDLLRQLSRPRTPHESPPVMWIPLADSGALSLAGGCHQDSDFLHAFFPVQETPENQSLMMISVAAGLIGILYRLARVCGQAGDGQFPGSAFKFLYTHAVQQILSWMRSTTPRW